MSLLNWCYWEWRHFPTVTALTLGVFLQVEYCPCVVPGDCWNLMKEFMQSFLGSSVPELPSVFAAKPEGLFAPADSIDTMTQYLELFNKLRKLQIPGSNVRWVVGGSGEISFYVCIDVALILVLWISMVSRHIRKTGVFNSHVWSLNIVLHLPVWWKYLVWKRSKGKL